MEIKPIKIKEYYEIPVEGNASILINLNDNSFLNNLDELRKYATKQQVELNREIKGEKKLEEEIVKKKSQKIAKMDKEYKGRAEKRAKTR